ncbi:MAG: endoglucanase [Agathobacter sp.]
MSSKIAKHISYEYKNAPIPGGGYVTGLIYHKKQPGILYARTDIGGTYRFDRGTMHWESLINHVSGENLAEAFPIGLALDDEHPERLYIISGEYKAESGVLSISEDFGRTFIHKTVPTRVHGNLSGRGTGYRLVVDKNNSNVLYFASQLGGLWKTTDRGDTWERLPLEEDYTTFVWVSNDSKTIVVGTAGYVTRIHEKLRGHSLYVSYDAGKNFEKLIMPENVLIEDSKMNGLVASRYDYDGTYLYVTMNSTGRWNYIVDLGYSCDTGDVIGGKVIRYYFENGRIAGFHDITPDGEGQHTAEHLNYGFGGICSCQARPGLLACSTLCREKEKPEAIYVSEDYGNTWRISLEGLEQGGIYFRTSYMQPKYNAGVSLLHWLSDVKIDPFNPNELWFNSGTGVFTTDALLSEHPAYHDYCDGIEETVHLNVYAPLDGEVQLVDIVGDLGGFAFRDLSASCTNSFDDAEGNRYITCINADLSDTDSNLAVITARGNWKGKTKGGLVRTVDGFHTYQRIPMYFELGGKIAEKMHHIEKPNNNPGWVAMSPDGKNIVWSIAEDIELPIDLVIVSQDGGESFRRVKVYNSKQQQVENGLFKAFSDRINSQLFYGFGEKGQLYVSCDGGTSFYEKQPIVQKAEYVDSISVFPDVNFGKIDTVNKTEVRGVAGTEGVFYMALAHEGLWKYQYIREKDEIICTKLTDEADSCFRMGLGIGRAGGSYIKEPKAVYLCGIIEGEYGLYRTLDDGKSFERLNDAHQMYGEINSIDGDKRKFGRFFLATGSRGVLYGEMKE